jgi:very-short-patch-repair endonuclease
LPRAIHDRIGGAAGIPPVFEDASLNAVKGLDASVVKRIQQSRRELLDLSARNRLISTPRESSWGRKIEIVDERSDEVFRLLVRERRAMSFLAGAQEDEQDGISSSGLAQPDDESGANGAPDPRHTDLRLQTRLTSERLQSRLLDMYYDAQTYEQEQGVSILYLAMGFLKWHESDASDKARFAPLMLVPVELERPSAASRFHLRFREDDVTTNLSLQAKLKDEFGIALPDIPEMEEIQPESYLNAVAQAVDGHSRWQVLRDDMILWFFSFAKYLMYRDLDPANWPTHSPLESNPTLSSLLGEGFVAEPALCCENDKIDSLISAADMVHVTEADSSQAVVIEEVRRRRNLVVQGPPGTGKSQTIANLIGIAVASGKKVLFVAEKMAALEVVQGRLERLGLGAICLELHSHKANKKLVLDELARTLSLGRPRLQLSAEHLDRLQAAIRRLNRHSEFMNTPIAPSAPTPFQIIGRLTCLYRRGAEPSNLELAGMETWSMSEFRERCSDVEDLQTHLATIGPPVDHPWCGVNRAEPILHPEHNQLREKLSDAVAFLTQLSERVTEFAELLEIPQDQDCNLKEAQRLAQFAIRLVNSPPMDVTRIVDPAWENRAAAIAGLVEQGRVLAETSYYEQHRLLEGLRVCLARVGPASEHPYRGMIRSSPLDAEESRLLFARIPKTIDSLASILKGAGDLERSLHIGPRPDASLKDIEQLAELATNVLKAPRMDRRQLAHTIWDTSRDQLSNIVNQGRTLADMQIELGEKISEVAWHTELSATRRHIAGYGDSFLRIFNPKYREALATFKGVLKGKAPRKLHDRLKLIDAVISAQAVSRSLDADGPVSQSGRDGFGIEWQGSRSDWANLGEILAWDDACRNARLTHNHRTVLMALEQPEPCRDALKALTMNLRPSIDDLEAIFRVLQLDCSEAIGVDNVLLVPVRILVDRLRAWQDRPEGAFEWIDYQASRCRLDAAGMGDVASAIHESCLTVDAALNDLQFKFHQALERDVAVNRRDRREGGSSYREYSSIAEPGFAGLGRDAFGSQWKGFLSDWSALEAVVKWDSECRGASLAWNHRYHLSRLDSVDRVRPSLRSFVAAFNRITELLQPLFSSLQFNIVEAFARSSQSRIPIRDLLCRLQRWQGDPEGLPRWIGYQIRRKRLKVNGLEGLVDGLHEGRICIGAAVEQLQVCYYQMLVRNIFKDNAQISEFDGQTYEQWVKEFRDLDQARIEMARGEVAVAHYDGIPRNAIGGEMAVVRREIEKKRRHKPIRQLLKDAGTAILAIKPVFMMSPISVAQFLESGALTFDLLIIDEASQVHPVDAFGAMARARQVVVVGDDKQLPPTRFFRTMLDEGAEDPDDGINAGDLESILGLCIAQGMSQRMLRWHYRSRHHSLIAVSNREFYENHLCVVPSPTTITSMHGLHFRLVKGGVYDRGNSATNPVEAKEIANAVIDHAKQHPNKSLAVGTFSVAQRDAIRGELELLLREHVELSAYFSPGRPEPFFVKNLENIQGDERDVIFISVGYARDSSGYMAMNFGPLSSQGGERRLNVLISRARERCEVFSSITADDIDLQRAKSRGAAAFKTFLRYAATGDLDAQSPTGGDYGSDFENQVAIALEERGYEVHRQVGTVGFIIDLAVIDSERPGRYLLGIECDGATYHSSRSARDRDRLRELVLRDRGWRIHRVWSTDWFHRSCEQLQKIIDAIQSAERDAHADEELNSTSEQFAIDPTISEVDRTNSNEVEEPIESASVAWIVPYVEANLDVPRGTPIHESKLSELTRIVVGVVAVEGPIHSDEVARRVTSLWGLQRTGARIAEAISRALQSAIDQGLVQAQSEFFTHKDQITIPVRRRTDANSASLKKPEMISPSEMRQTMLHLMAENVGVRRDEIPLMVAKALGFGATGAKLKHAIESELERMLKESLLVFRDEKLFLRANSTVEGESVP